MRITHIFKTYFPDTQGGLEEAIRQIAQESVNAGFDVSVVSLSKKPQSALLDGVHTKSYFQNFDFFSNPFSLDLMKNINDIIASSDIIHLQFPWPTGELLVLLSGTNKPIVLTFHCDIHKKRFFKTLYSPFIHGILQKSNIIVSTSQALLETTPMLRRYRSKCEVINLWLDKKRFERCDFASYSIPKYIQQLDDFALFVGVLRWYKGLDILLDSAQKVRGTIVIVGSGPLLPRLQERIEREKIENVLLLGYQNDMILNYLLDRCRFTVLPSTSPAEAFGQILLESCYFGKPMVTSELGTGTSFVNLNGNTGIVIPPDDSKALSQAMNRLFKSDLECKRFGENAAIRLEQFFTAEKQAGKYVRIYERLMS